MNRSNPKHTLVLLLFCLFSILGTAQNETADKYYAQLGYKEAIERYRSGELKLQAMERIAHGYRLNHDTQNAEKWYSQVVEDSDDPLNTLYYAQALHSNGQLEKAKEYYLKYDETMGGDDERGRLLANAIDRISSFEDNEKIKVEMVRSINSEKLDFSPTYFQNGLIFVSNRQAGQGSGNGEKDLWTGDSYNAHFFAKENEDGSLATPELFLLQLADKYHEGPLCFTKSGDEVYFTRNIKKRNKNKEYSLKIYSAMQRSEDFGEVKLLDLADANCNDAHPALSPDGGHLYFASDREGGFGGMDIYRAAFSGGKWGTPVNLGPTVNTPGNEVFPFVYSDGTLYFASDGWGGLGGLDVFYTEPKGENDWGAVQNIGTPINSSMDDFSYILNPLGTEGYFTSARDGGQGKDDIYRFILAKPQGNKNKEKKWTVPICVYDELTGERLSNVKVSTLMEGGDGSYQGLEDDFVVRLIPTEDPDEFAISFRRRDPFGGDDGENETYTTNKEGRFQVTAKDGKDYMFIAKLGGYQETRISFSADEMADTGAELCIPMSTTTECVTLKGLVTNRRFGNPLPNAKLTMIDLCSGETFSTTSNELGNYHFSCLPCGCDFIVKGEKENFRAGSGMASTIDMDCTQGNLSATLDLELYPAFNEDGSPAVASFRENGSPNNPYTNTAPSYNPEGYPGNSTSHPYEPFPSSGDKLLKDGLTFEINDIYYDFDESFIRNYDAAPDLDHLVNLLLRHPSLRVELRSHTDSRGTDAYNMALSQRRAAAALSYVKSRGVEPYRISASGYGERYLSNECTDGVECTEQEHQMNRRTEVKLYGQLRRNGL